MPTDSSNLAASRSRVKALQRQIDVARKRLAQLEAEKEEEEETLQQHEWTSTADAERRAYTQPYWEGRGQIRVAQDEDVPESKDLKEVLRYSTEVEKRRRLQEESAKRKERRSHYTEGHRGPPFFEGKRITKVKKDLEWLLRHLGELEKKRDEKGKSESNWARRRIPRIQERVKAAKDIVTKAEAKSC
jgi:hypothetical protein